MRVGYKLFIELVILIILVFLAVSGMVLYKANQHAKELDAKARQETTQQREKRQINKVLKDNPMR